MPKYGINKAILLGNVGTDPELRYLDQGVAVCSFRLATTERVKHRDGQLVDRTEWHNIVLWRQKAELAQKHFRTGTGLYIEGRIVSRSWDGPDGQKRFKTEIEADTVRMLDGQPETGSTAEANPSRSPRPDTRPTPPVDPQAAKSSSEEDLPF
jgi:single-strand DNA-binding protein